jgi:DNA polymerase III epsilon subunit family exonuclease
MAASVWVQTSLDELDEPLRTTTFTVVDLETTGGAAGTDAITEIGAVQVRAGEVLGEFQTLVDPGVAISPFVSVLTGITDAMVRGCPPISAVLPAFLEFARGSVLVAHNAPFDVGFLRAACTELEIAWPGFAVVDTAILARRVLTRDEVPNCKLSTLAGYFRSATTPNHRALHDARATVDVLHSLIGRLGTLGVQSLPELRAFTAQVSDAQRRKRHLADGLPERPGVYIFRDERGAPLYVGTSRNLRTRVRQYFVASETRSRMGEMIGLAARVDPVECAHALEAQVRELRLIAAHKPRYNRRSKFPERSVWLKLTVEVRPAPPTSARCARSGRPRPSVTRSTMPSRCASAVTGYRCAGSSGRHACWPASAGAARRAKVRRHQRRTDNSRPRCPRRGPGTCARWSSRCNAGSPSFPRPSASSRQPRSGTGSPRWFGRVRACSDWPRCAWSRRWSRRGRTGPAGGS